MSSDMKGSIKKPALSYGLVAIQFLAMAGMLLSADWIALNVWGLMQLAGALLAIWAVLTMHLGRFNIVPDPRPDGVLVQTGPYRWIRHPMYASLLYVFFPMTVTHASFETSVLFGVLVFDLLIKLHYEEQLLINRFTDYVDYQRRTQRLIPYLY
ncbi:isoprenylcysteine carboxyl methyltransferase [Hydrogenovibrio sp. SC-1]|uniref:methyltransferase family protein n=1 Tax=Hydrogenovibrio sp. SC-1 TaxID=2065820 RepID=UPI000C7CD3C0|nr:isoprenylcysteine carboxylmethyltransferase family protein [Hydrogenovibrio sp. SC-1]PLA74783.1 isoprenylcysteine carboxyl methyltransferase [Hydrogenovibrio sp. SC-1]